MDLRGLTLVCAAVTAIALAACGGGDGDDGGGAGAAECAPARARAAGDATETIMSGGLERTYILHVPPQYDGARALPLVLNFHGFGSNAVEQARYSRLPQEGDAQGFIVVTPDGTGEPRRWSNAGLGAGVDDVAFVGELLDRLEGELCVEEGRVYAAGMSNGAAFSMQLACAMPGRIAGAAAVTALVYPFRCAGAGPVPVIGFHGTEDPCVPFGGGQTQCGAMLPVPAIETSALNWARHNGCAVEPAEEEVSERVRRISYGGCAEGAEVVLYVAEGAGHTWPGSIDVPRLGATTREIDATELIWAFFSGER